MLGGTWSIVEAGTPPRRLRPGSEVTDAERLCRVVLDENVRRRGRTVEHADYEEALAALRGSTFQSAASALALDGASVVAGIVIGRVIHPEFSDETGALWDQQRKVPFDFNVCCLNDVEEP